MVGAGDAAKLSAKVATASTLGSVKVDGTTIEVDNAGEISAKIPNPLKYKGNINPTTEDSGPDNISSYTGSPGDAYTCSWGGTKVEGTLGTTPADKNWANAIKGSDTTATLGDLLIINSGDGSNANEWTLVKTGTVDSGASIDVGDGKLAAFPPSSPQEGDVWYNLDDGRTYVYITDSSSDKVWVDISPQGNQTLWKKDTANQIEPVTTADNLRLANLAGGTSTAGTTVVMANSSGVLVSNAAGTGLEIVSGSLQIDADAVPLPGGGDGNGDAGFWNRTNSTDTLTTRTSGDKVTIGGNLKCGSSNIFFEYRPANGVCQLKTNATTAAQSILYGQSGFGGSTFDAFKFTVDGSATFGSVAYLNAEGVRSNSQATLVSYANDGSTATAALYADGKLLLGNNTSAPNTSLLANGSAEFASGAALIGIQTGTTGDGGLRLTNAGKTVNIDMAGSDGSARFGGTVQVGGNPNTGTAAGFSVTNLGLIRAARTNGTDPVLNIYTQGTNKITAAINANGSAYFLGAVRVGENAGSAASNTSGIYNNTDGNLILYKSSTTSSNFITATKHQGSGSSFDAIFSISDDAVIKVASGGGIHFADYGSGATIDSNLLDDYEQGTWTPTIGAHNIGQGITLDSFTNTRYTKIGRYVYLSGQLVINSNTSTENVAIGDAFYLNGTPFTVYTDSYQCSATALLDSSTRPNRAALFAGGGNTASFICNYKDGTVQWALGGLTIRIQISYRCTD